ncbi:V-type proton ATPase subunit E-like [Brevipalpus obovatus]|uniref:V-type proton ATPase subunit E-like n=1 Tax=Brevipalpus obovatus TaxID=246614 RepID=UPI003D9F3210
MSLSNADVQKQIQHMMAFIEQEAQEKAEEVETKAEEEFEIEKGRLVNEQRMKIIDHFEKKEKMVEIQRKIQNSHMLQSARLRLLKAREDHIRSVTEEARQKLIEVTKNQQTYAGVLRKLIAQSLFLLLEDKVVIHCRQQDQNIIESVLQDALEDYKKATGKECKAVVDNEKRIHHDSCGGIEMTARGGKIKITNTLESRLELIIQSCLPLIRVALFGRNPNRSHDD